MARIFLSHSSKDNAAAIALAGWLDREGWNDVFLDLDPRRGIAAGERWERKLHEAASRCEAVLFLVSPAWLASRWCLREFDLARKLNKRVFGVLIEDVAFKKLPRDLTDTWQMANLAAGADHALFPVSLPHTGADAHATFSKAGLASLKEGLRRAGLDPSFFAWPPKDDPSRPPYRGMRALEAEDAGIFFGREAPTVEVLDLLRGLREAPPPRLLAILGASGAGKSSFLRAGLVARLRRDEGSFLVLPALRPERAALSGETGLVRCLEAALTAAGLRRARSAVMAAVDGGADAVARLLAELGAKSGGPALVLPVDQGEELFLADGAAEAQALLVLLRDLLPRPEANLIVVVAIRSDAVERLQLALAELTPKLYPLQPLPRGAYQAVIEGPALRLKDTPRALHVEPALTQALLADIEAGGAKDALPLLAFTLERLYLDHGGDGDLKLSEYRETGGIRGAIEAAVERALARADADPAVPKDRDARLALLRRALIPWLAGIDPETNAPRRQVARASEIPPEAMPLVQHLIAERLLASDRDEATGAVTIEPAHEALLRQWGLLTGWLEEDAAALSILDGVKRAARDWESNARNPDWLAHAAGRLEDAERFAAAPAFAGYLVSPEREYVGMCRTADTARRDKELEDTRKLVESQATVAKRTRTGLLVAACLALLALGAAYFAFQQKTEAENQTALAEDRANEAKKQADLAAEQKELADVAAAKAREQADLANRERKQAILNETIVLAALSQIEFLNKRNSDAIKLALAAWPRRGDENRPQLRRVLDRFTAGLPGLWHMERTIAHTNVLSSTAWSPDGRRIMSVSDNEGIRIWDARTGALLTTLASDDLDEPSAAWSPNGDKLVTASKYSAMVRIWDATTGSELSSFGLPEGNMMFVAWSPDERQVATISYIRGILVRDPETGEIVDEETRSTESPFQIWDIKTGTLLKTLTLRGAKTAYAAWSPDGCSIAVTSDYNKITIFKTETGEVLTTLMGHQGEVVSANWSPSGLQIVTASEDMTARIWDADSGSLLTTLTGHEDTLSTAAFSVDGQQIVTASADRTARIWDAGTGELLTILTGHKDSLSSAAFSPAGSHIVTSSRDKTIRIWRLEAGTLHTTLTGHKDILGSAEWSPDGNRLVTTTMYPDQSVHLWDANTGIYLSTLIESKFGVHSPSWSPDGLRIVAATENHTATIWNAITGGLLTTLEGHMDYVSSAHFSLDGRCIVTASSDKTARIWDADSGSLLITLTGHEESLSSAVFSSDGLSILTASQDGTARLWDGKSGAPLATLAGHEGWVLSAAFSPDGTRIVTASGDKTARLWDGKSGAALVTLVGHEKTVLSAAFSPGGTRIVTASWDTTARIWDAETGVALTILTGHEDGLESAAFSPDGHRIVTASRDKTARIWNISTLEEGNTFEIACERLGDNTDLADIEQRYGLAKLPPICGEYAPLPVDL